MILPAWPGSAWGEQFRFCWYGGAYPGVGSYSNPHIGLDWRSNTFISSHMSWITTSWTYLNVSLSWSVVTNCRTGGRSTKLSPELSVGELSCSTGKSMINPKLFPISLFRTLRSCANHFSTLPHKRRQIISERKWMRWDENSNLHLADVLLIWQW